MNDLMHLADQKIHALYGLPGYALVAISCIIFGFVMKRIRKFPNDAIPLVVCMLGAILNPLLADAEPAGSSHRAWIVRNIVIGLIVGFLSWMFHKVIIKKILAQAPALKSVVGDFDSAPPFAVDGATPKPQPAPVAVNDPKPMPTIQ